MAISSQENSGQITNAASWGAVCVIFLSIVPLACVELWFEAVVFAAVFILSGVTVFQNTGDVKNWRMVVPLVLLAVYSFVQGLVTILAQSRVLPSSNFLPESFDGAVSLWSALKILAFALFLQLLFVKVNSRVLLWSLIFTGNFFAVLGTARFLLQASFPDVFGYFIFPQLKPNVGFGTFLNQNHFAYLMLMVLGLNLSVFWYGGQTKAVRFLLAIASLITWTALILTGSRGGIIGSFVEVAVLMFLPVFIRVSHRSRHLKPLSSKILLAGRQLAILAAVSVVLIFGIVLVGQDRVVTRFEHISQEFEDVTYSPSFQRIEVWQATVEIIKENPVFGVGFGGFRTAVSQFIDISGQIVPREAHNDYLEFAASGGIVAVALALWFWYGFFSLVRRRFAESTDVFSLAVRIGAICAVAGVAFHSLFDFGLQLIPNLLFFTALLFLTVHQSPNGENEPNGDSPQGNALFRFGFPALCLSLAFVSVFYGFARYQCERAKKNRYVEIIETYKIPFDSNYLEAKAVVYEKLEDYATAANALREAINYRPKDYALWMKLGQIEERQQQNDNAENAFRRAAELAPLYGAPRFFYGSLLVKNNRKDAGFAELRTASQRNLLYFNKVANLIWRETNGSAEEAVKYLSPHNSITREHLVSFLFNKSAFPAIVQLVCREEDLSAASRDAVIRKLLEKRHYSSAAQVSKRDCNNSNQINGEIADGDFEKGEINEGYGFGWRVNPASESVRFVLEEDTAAKNQSLRFDFNGNDNFSILLSQIVVVEKKRKYQLNFSYKTKELVTGGAPVLQLIAKQPDTELMMKEIPLSLNESVWKQNTVVFQTGEQTEAIEIRLIRQSCTEPLCPIFGRLWLDKFSLQKMQ